MRGEDFEAAKAIDLALHADRIPEAPLAEGPGQEGECPACATPLMSGAESCAECGLEFPPLEQPCPACHSPVSVDHERCPGCGTAVDWGAAGAPS